MPDQEWQQLEEWIAGFTPAVRFEEYRAAKNASGTTRQGQWEKAPTFAPEDQWQAYLAWLKAEGDVG